MTDTAHDLWERLSAYRTDLMNRCELLARYTLPHLWTPVGGNADRDGTGKDWQSLGALCVNHLVTRLMLTLFSPSRPFIRYDAGPKLLQDAADQNVGEEDLAAMLAEAERKAVKKLDQLSLRPKLFEALKHIIVFGNVLMVFDKKNKLMRVISLKHYVVKRDIVGRLHTLVIRERVCFDELSEDAQEATPAGERPAPGSKDNEVDFYIQIERQPGGSFKETQWVGKTNLGADFEKTYKDEAALPYRVQTWTIADEANYGSGLVGECENDFAALSTMSRAVIESAIMASEYRWLLSPGSQMRPEDFKESENGSVIPGQKGDLELVNAAAALGAAMEVQQRTVAEYVNRIGRTFLLSSSVIRQAERVTAEEIRLQAQELETGLGGGYSRLAVDIQLPLGMWLIELTGIKFLDSEAEPVVVTGLDALSRNGDLDNLRGYLQDVATIGALPEPVLIYLKLDAIFTDLGTGHGLVGRKYVATAQEVAAKMAQQRQAQVGTDVATAAGQAAAKGAATQ